VLLFVTLFSKSAQKDGDGKEGSKEGMESGKGKEGKMGGRPWNVKECRKGRTKANGTNDPLNKRNERKTHV
jgi:hypothetical protein